MTKAWNVLFVGAGRMAEAVIAGLVRENRDVFNQISVTNQSNKEKLQYLQHTYGIQPVTDWLKAVQQSDMIVLAAPPQAHEQLLQTMKPVLRGQLVITVAAGIDTDYLEFLLPKGTPACWIMPNTAAQVGMSMSTYSCGAHVTAEHRIYIEALLEAVGPSEELSQQLVHDMTAVTGSAPAFIYYVAEALKDAAVSYGISEEQALRLVTQMLKGSAAMLEAGHDPKDLMEQVASPGGSTAEGLEVLETYDTAARFRQAVEAANNHAKGGGKS
ncbi:pyrroline-5-carboxylate reductase [Alkalicoccus chagannorensis]|uniref:pyrroline-5-carboxylate reductase n=1 Tax=Alkalicoccus chagannorensis TaxID=427072 RepID=UPI00040DFCFC|nr:pyrroline-5-carboxylate reductase [Alkalicoccus chagannorensis]